MIVECPELCFVATITIIYNTHTPNKPTRCQFQTPHEAVCLGRESWDQIGENTHATKTFDTKV